MTDVIDWESKTTAELTAEISAIEAGIMKLDRLARAAMDARDWGRTLDLQDERSKAVARLTYARGQLALRAARMGRLP
jgi:hypothetical protein